MRFEIRLKTTINNDDNYDHFDEFDSSNDRKKIEIAQNNIFIIVNLHVFEFNSCIENIDMNMIKIESFDTNDINYAHFFHINYSIC